MNVYDFDGTIYDGDSTVDFFLYALKRKPSLIRYLPKQAYGCALYVFKRIDRTRLKEFFFCFLRSTDIDSLLESFWNEKQSKIYGWYHEKHKDDDVVISASPEFLLKPICESLGIKCLIASKVDASTGKFVGENCRGEEKVRRFYEVYPDGVIDDFYTDSLSDLPLIKISKSAFIVTKESVTPYTTGEDHEKR